MISVMKSNGVLRRKDRRVQDHTSGWRTLLQERLVTSGHLRAVGFEDLRLPSN